jgi:hypothetical protein
MRSARPKRVSTNCAARDLFEHRDDFGDRRRGHDLAIRASAEQPLERRQVLGDLRPVFRRGSEWIDPVGDAIEDDFDRRAQ